MASQVSSKGAISYDSRTEPCQLVVRCTQLGSIRAVLYCLAANSFICIPSNIDLYKRQKTSYAE